MIIAFVLLSSKDCQFSSVSIEETLEKLEKSLKTKRAALRCTISILDMSALT